METRDIVENVVGGPIRTTEDGLAALRRAVPEGDWSVERVEPWWLLLTSDQWIVRSESEDEFTALVVGAAAAAAVLRLYS